MITDQQIRRLFKMKQDGLTLAVSAAKAGMDVRTARKYLRAGKLPREMQTIHNWRTRPDPFDEVWGSVREQLELDNGLEAKTLFEDLQQRYPGRFGGGQLRTLQRRIKVWRATQGPPKEVFFGQIHQPGRLSQSDFTHMSDLYVTIAGQAFPHLIYHFVLTYSNWEHGTVCFSESFESLSEGLQNALWALGGVPAEHQTDRLTSAVNNLPDTNVFQKRYQQLLDHYKLNPRTIQAGQANENGDVEQRHHRFKRALDQALRLRGSRDFVDRAEYDAFLHKLMHQLNESRRQRVEEERALLDPLPSSRLESRQVFRVRVNSGSLIHVGRNTYSVESRLIGELVEVRLYAERLEVWYGQCLMETLPRLLGRGGHRVCYRHIIDWLIRKPGAFENYRYRDDLFPNSHFRMVYDILRQSAGTRTNKKYLQILYLAAHTNEDEVDQALVRLLAGGGDIDVSAVEALVEAGQRIDPVTDVIIDKPNPAEYDVLLSSKEVA